MVLRIIMTVLVPHLYHLEPFETDLGGNSSIITAIICYRTLYDFRNGEGVRQSIGDWQTDPNFVWSKHVLVPPLRRSELVAAREVV